MKQKSMMQTRGLVVKTEKDGFAQVVMDRKSACSGCDAGKADNCRSCLTRAKIKARVLNAEGAVKGDIVIVSLSRSKAMKGAAAFYLIPVVCLLAGAFIGNSIGNALIMDNSLSAMTGGFISLVTGFYIVRKISEQMNSDQGLIPEITKIVSFGSAGPPGKKEFLTPKNICPGCR